jgi:hypothetical protein
MKPSRILSYISDRTKPMIMVGPFLLAIAVLESLPESIPLTNLALFLD